MNWKAGYPFRMIGSSGGMPNCRPCLEFDQVCQDIPYEERSDAGETYVSTNPVLDPLAAESFRPCGSAR